ncbi:PE-PGRS family protein PE_PGRS18 [Mycobacterium simulans]|nr:PE-PGRS family protein PE_PGRS18 [Mycobacterium simulans]
MSAAIAALFSEQAQQFQAVNGQIAVFHDRFVQGLRSAGGAYAVAEAANASPLQVLERAVLEVINAHRLVAFRLPGRALIWGSGRRDPRFRMFARARSAGHRSGIAQRMQYLIPT